MTKMMKLFAAFFTGNLVFVFFYAGICWLVSRLDVTPYGRFVNTFFKGRDPKQAQAYIEAHKALFDRMLPEAVHFSNLVITPFAGFVMGIIMGLIISTRDKTTAVIGSLVSAVPVTVLFWIKSGRELGTAPYLLLFLVVVAIGAFLGNAISVAMCGHSNAV